MQVVALAGNGDGTLAHLGIVAVKDEVIGACHQHGIAVLDGQNGSDLLTGVNITFFQTLNGGGDDLGGDGEVLLGFALVVALQSDLDIAVGLGGEVLTVGDLIIGAFRQHLVAVLDGDGGLDSLAVIAVGASHALDGGGDLLGGDGHFQLSLGAILQRQISGESAGIDPVALVSHSGQGIDALQRTVSLDSLFAAVIDSAAIQGQRDLAAVSTTAVDAGADDLRAGSGIAPVMGDRGVGSVRVVGILPLGIGTGGIAVVNRRAVEGGNSLDGLTVVQILAPDTAQQVSHLAGGELVSGLLLHLGLGRIGVGLADRSHDGIAVLNGHSAIRRAHYAANDVALLTGNCADRPAVFQQTHLATIRHFAGNATGAAILGCNTAGIPTVSDNSLICTRDAANVISTGFNRSGVSTPFQGAGTVVAHNTTTVAGAGYHRIAHTAGNCSLVVTHNAADTRITIQIGVGQVYILYHSIFAGGSNQAYKTCIYIVEIQAGNSLAVAIKHAIENERTTISDGVPDPQAGSVGGDRARVDGNIVGQHHIDSAKVCVVVIHLVGEPVKVTGIGDGVVADVSVRQPQLSAVLSGDQGGRLVSVADHAVIGIDAETVVVIAVIGDLGNVGVGVTQRTHAVHGDLINIRAVQSGDILPGLIVIDVLTPDIGTLGGTGPQQIGNLAGGKLVKGLLLCIGHRVSIQI